MLYFSTSGSDLTIMSQIENESHDIQDKKDVLEPAPQKKSPFSFFSGAFTSALFAYLFYQLSQRLVIYFTLHSISYSSPIAQSVASGFKTLVIGISFLATFTFGFIGLGLTVVFIRSLIDGNSKVAS